MSPEQFKLVHYTTTESEQAGLLSALKRLDEQYPGQFSVDFRAKNAGATSVDALLEATSQADFFLATLMGSLIQLDDADRLFSCLRDLGVPFHVQSSVASHNEKLTGFTNLPDGLKSQVHDYLLAGGQDNYYELLKLLANNFTGTNYPIFEPSQTPWAGIYTPNRIFDSIDEFLAAYPSDGIRVGLLFNRSQFVSGNLKAIDAIFHRGIEMGLVIIPVFFYSVAATDAGNESLAETLRRLWLKDGACLVDVVCSMAGFSLNTPSTIPAALPESILETLDVPALKAIASTDSYQHWADSAQGCCQVDYSFNFVMPEFDGLIIGQLTSTKEREVNDQLALPKHSPAEGLDAMLETCRRYGRLRRLENSDKKVAIILHNYPTGDAYIGSASGLDTFASVLKVLSRLKDQGYNVGELPGDEIALREAITAHGSNERRWVSSDNSVNLRWLSASDYQKYFDSLPEISRQAMIDAWGEPPGDVLTSDAGILIPGVQYGNVFIAVQPSRGYGDDPDKIIHDVAAPPPHQYLAYYHYLRDCFEADAFIHVGTHGSLEFLPGKSLGLAQSDFPQLLINNVPNFYCYIIKNPGEGTIAKRRSFADIVSYLLPALAFANSYDQLEDLEGLLEAYENAHHQGHGQDLTIHEQRLREHIHQINLDSDLDIDQASDIEQVVTQVEAYLSQIHASFIKLGMHVLGVPLEGEDLVNTVAVIMRLDNGEITGIPAALASGRGLNWDEIGDSKLADQLIADCLNIVRALAEADWSVDFAIQLADNNPVLAQSLSYICTKLVPNLRLVTDELDHLLHGLAGGFIPPGASGNVSRGGADLLPTGRNFYTLDPRTVPTPSAWVTGQKLGAQLLSEYANENDAQLPQSIGIVLWGLSTIRSCGDDLAEILWLLGLRPCWQKSTGRISGLEVIDSVELGRPRIDVTVRISGLFRDMFPQAIDLLNEAFALVAGLADEPYPNYLREHVLADRQEAIARGEQEDEANNHALLRIFGSAYGSYGTGVSTAVDESAWKDRENLADIYLTWGSFAYGPGSDGQFNKEAFISRLSKVEATVQNATSRETDILDVDDYYQYHGGLANTVAHVKGKRPAMYCGDSSDPGKLRLRRADKELKFVYRNKILNPLWAKRLQEHGYKAGSDFSKMVSNAFGWDATSDILDDWMYEELAQRYALDAQMQEFLKTNNPQAQFDIVEQLLEAEQRGMWQANPETLAQLKQLYLQIESHLEGEGN